MVTERRRIYIIEPRLSEKKNESIDEVALDEPVCIFVNREHYVTLIATPEMKRELAVGHLLSEGILCSLDDLASVEIRSYDVLVETRKKVDFRVATDDMVTQIVKAYRVSPRMKGKSHHISRVESELRVKVATLMAAISELNKKSSVHLKTRGTHAAMLCSMEGEPLSFAEDVGRHNAVDKVVGDYFLRGGDLGNCILLSTGRQSGEMVQKAAMVGIPIVCSMAVPLVSGLRLAEATGVSLASLSSGMLKLYTYSERIV